MRAGSLRLLKLALAVAFAASGFWQPCFALTMPAPAAAVPMAHHAVHSDAHGAMHMTHADHHHALAALDDGASKPPASADKDCQKCCGLCAPGTLSPAAPLAAITLSVASPVVAPAPRPLVASLILLDPGIPKRIA
ncbi:MAG TPA: hypothetical protein VFB45_22050 [Pseudolabrys sp.]|nr:hypothetical protein [Pseudolabrys sp.]